MNSRLRTKPRILSAKRIFWSRPLSEEDLYRGLQWTDNPNGAAALHQSRACSQACHRGRSRRQGTQGGGWNSASKHCKNIAPPPWPGPRGAARRNALPKGSPSFTPQRPTILSVCTGNAEHQHTHTLSLSHTHFFLLLSLYFFLLHLINDSVFHPTIRHQRRELLRPVASPDSARAPALAPTL